MYVNVVKYILDFMLEIILKKSSLNAVIEENTCKAYKAFFLNGVVVSQLRNRNGFKGLIRHTIFYQI